MSALKDRYIKLLEEREAELLDQGVPEDEAYDRAGELAYDDLKEQS